LALSLSPSDPRACLPPVRPFLPVASFVRHLRTSLSPFRRTGVPNPPARAPPPPESALDVTRSSRQQLCCCCHRAAHMGMVVRPYSSAARRRRQEQLLPAHRRGWPGTGAPPAALHLLGAAKEERESQLQGPLLLRRSRFVCRGRVAQGRGRGTFLPAVLCTPRDDGERICLRPAPRVNLEQGRRQPRVPPRSTSRRWRRRSGPRLLDLKCRHPQRISSLDPARPPDPPVPLACELLRH
jgi:hypothetical protein